MRNFKIGFIGAGNIAGAIIGGILSSGYIIPENIYVFDTDEEKVSGFVEKGICKAFSSCELVKGCDFVFLTVKPQIYPAILEEINPYADGKCFVDVAAGITIDFVKKALGFDAAVIRVMPNTPLMVGKGSSALVLREPVTAEQFNFIKGIFDINGVTITTDEELINTVTAVSGSAPAFILQFAEYFIDYAVSSGLERKSAERLILNTFIGSAEMALGSEEPIKTLIENVTSKGGTTAAGRAVLEEKGFKDIVDSCLDATKKRAEELTK